MRNRLLERRQSDFDLNQEFKKHFSMADSGYFSIGELKEPNTQQAIALAELHQIVTSPNDNSLVIWGSQVKITSEKAKAKQVKAMPALMAWHRSGHDVDC